MTSVVVLDYGTGNVHSAVKALELAGADVELTRDRGRVQSADGLFVPGVGAFGAVRLSPSLRRRLLRCASTARLSASFT